MGTSRLDVPGALSTIIWKVCNGGSVYFAKTGKGLRELPMEEAIAALQWIPDEEIYSEVPADAHIATVSLSGMSEARSSSSD